MNKTKPKIVVVLLGIALLLTCLSVKIEGTYQGYVGNVCEHTFENPRGVCYADLPKGGFPLAYLFDNGGVTGEGRLEPVLDSWEILPFVVDFSLYFLLLWAPFKIHTKMHRGRTSGDKYGSNA